MSGIPSTQAASTAAKPSVSTADSTLTILTYDLNPEESRERTDEGMELILRVWKKPEPFGWQGRHFHYRTVSVWPKPPIWGRSETPRNRAC